MHQIGLSDEIYREAERRAAAGGFSSVDQYVADLLSLDLGPPDDFDRCFTPGRLAHIDHASAQIAAGECFTSEQADAELAKRRAQWLRENESAS